MSTLRAALAGKPMPRTRKQIVDVLQNTFTAASTEELARRNAAVIVDEATTLANKIRLGWCNEFGRELPWDHFRRGWQY